MTDWTPSTTHAHFTALMEQQEKAIRLVEDNAAHWRAQANEWRGAMTDRERNFVTRNEVDARFRGLEQQLAEVKEAMQISAGKAVGAAAVWGYIVGAAGLFLLTMQVLS